MNCRKCQAVLPEDAVFCGECGTRVERVAAAPLAVDNIATTVPSAGRSE